MDDPRFVLTAPQRWRLRVGLYLPPVIIFLPFLPEHLHAGLLAEAAWAPVGLYVVDLIHGSSRLTPQGLEVRSPLRRRRVIPWADIEEVASRTYYGKGGTATVALVHTASRRRPRRIPGLMHHTEAEYEDFRRSLEAVRTYRRKAAVPKPR